MSVLGTTYDPIFKIWFRSSAIFQSIMTMSTKVIKFKVPSKDTTKVDDKDAAWALYASEMKETMSKLYDRITSLNKELNEVCKEGLEQTLKIEALELALDEQVREATSAQAELRQRSGRLGMGWDYNDWREYGARHFNLHIRNDHYEGQTRFGDAMSSSDSESEDDEDTEVYYCCCQECGEVIPREDNETPEEQQEWFNEDDELKLCANCEAPPPYEQ